MKVRRVLILTITALVAGGAGYALLGLRAPKLVPASQTRPQLTAYQDTIIAVGPDGTLYAIRVPAGSGTGYGSTSGYGQTANQGFYSGRERERQGAFEYGTEHE